MCAFSMGHPLEIYAPYLRESEQKKAEKKNQQNTRIYKPIQCAQLNAAESEFEFEFKWQIFDSQKKAAERNKWNNNNL